jgi:DNA-directed RNA polymerase specialized sigma24 family protein
MLRVKGQTATGTTPEQIAEWFARHRASLERFAGRWGAAFHTGGSGLPAADVVQDAVLIALDRADRIRDVGALRAFVKATIRRLLANERRVKSNRRRITAENPLTFDGERRAEVDDRHHDEWVDWLEGVEEDHTLGRYDTTKPRAGRATPHRGSADDQADRMR